MTDTIFIPETLQNQNVLFSYNLTDDIIIFLKTCQYTSYIKYDDNIILIMWIYEPSCLKTLKTQEKICE